ncbi:MAG TPA: hypothetical protein VGE22_12460 [Solimonas sp.]
MIVFTIIGVLWFWMLCFEIGYGLIPACRVLRAGVAVWLLGREAESLMAIFAAAHREQSGGRQR